MTIKVIVTGAFSTGKTTLVDDLVGALRSDGRTCEVLPDVSRSCPLPLNTDQTDDTTLWLIGSQIAAEIAATARGADVVLCDRGVPDVLAHHLEVLSRHAEQRVELLRPFLTHWLTTYDILLLSRVEETIPIRPDGLRSTDADYRTSLDGYAAAVVGKLAATVPLPLDEPTRLAVSHQAVARLLD